jgi:predicted RNA-binding protein associated with RNAse of E/G family
VIGPGGAVAWKDVEHLSAVLRSGRMTERQVLDTLAAAEEVTDLLRQDRRWWSPWDSWTPERG